MIILNEEARRYLREDKMVKFNGEMFPKFGWCVILMGGSGSGKGTAFSFKVPIDGDYYNPDDLKEHEIFWNVEHDHVPYKDLFKTPVGGQEPVLNSDGSQKYDKHGNPMYQDKFRNMKNADFVTDVHMTMDGLSDKWKNSIVKKQDKTHADTKKLPNMIFDITGKKYSSVITDIVNVVKPQGYKVAIIWMLTKGDLAIKNNMGRPRSIPTSMLIDIHLKVQETVQKIFNSSVINTIDDFWLIDTATNMNPYDDPKAYHDMTNVYHIPCNSNGLKKFDMILDRLEYNVNTLNKKLAEINYYKEKGDIQKLKELGEIPEREFDYDKSVYSWK